MLEIGSQMAQEHSSTISVALEENEEQTISQSWGTEAASGAGVVWLFKYKIQYIDDRESSPCCLPGTFADHNNPHGMKYLCPSIGNQVCDLPGTGVSAREIETISCETVSTLAH